MVRDLKVRKIEAVAEDDWKWPKVSRCELFPRMNSQYRLRQYLDRYCLGEFTSCARYQYVLANKCRPPLELLPSGERSETEGTDLPGG